MAINTLRGPFFGSPLALALLGTQCDLGGSERLKKSEVWAVGGVQRQQATGENLKEAIEINRSLTALGDVIEARWARQPAEDGDDCYARPFTPQIGPKSPRKLGLLRALAMCYEVDSWKQRWYGLGQEAILEAARKHRAGPRKRFLLRYDPPGDINGLVDALIDEESTLLTRRRHREGLIQLLSRLYEVDVTAAEAPEEADPEPGEASDGMQGASVVLTGLTGSHQARGWRWRAELSDRCW
eukprot:Skav221406  [mRNA]  locus=scaffold1621:93886:100443:- [translate_table: standard]